MRVRINERGVHREPRVEEVCRSDPPCLRRQPEPCPIPVETPPTVLPNDLQVRLVRPEQQPLADATGGVLEDHLYGPVPVGFDVLQGYRPVRRNTIYEHTSLKLFEPHASKPLATGKRNPQTNTHLLQAPQTNQLKVIALSLLPASKSSMSCAVTKPCQKWRAGNYCNNPHPGAVACLIRAGYIGRANLRVFTRTLIDRRHWRLVTAEGLIGSPAKARNLTIASPSHTCFAPSLRRGLRSRRCNSNPTLLAFDATRKHALIDWRKRLVDGVVSSKTTRPGLVLYMERSNRVMVRLSVSAAPGSIPFVRPIDLVGPKLKYGALFVVWQNV